MKCKTVWSVTKGWALLRVWILVMNAALACAAVPAIASSPGSTAISILPSNGFAIPIYHYTPSSTVSLIVSIDRPQGYPNVVDVYVGALTPGGQVVSFIPGSEGTELAEGLVPFLKDVTDLSFNVFVPPAQVPKYTFTGNETFGLYSAFVFVVRQGGDPSREWIAASMVPIIFEPLFQVPTFP